MSQFDNKIYGDKFRANNKRFMNISEYTKKRLDQLRYNSDIPLIAKGSWDSLIDYLISFYLDKNDLEIKGDDIEQPKEESKQEYLPDGFRRLKDDF